MRNIGLIILVIVGLLLVSCQDTETGSIENEDTIIVQSQPVQIRFNQIAEEADIIANLTVTEFVDVLEIESGPEFTEYKSTVNRYYHDELDYGEEINFIQSGGPTMRFSGEPLLEVGKTYILFLNEHDDSDFGQVLAITGGPQGVFEKEDDVYRRHRSPEADRGLGRVTEAEFITNLNERVEKFDIDVSESEE